jgi:hypothetical protein
MLLASFFQSYVFELSKPSGGCYKVAYFQKASLGKVLVNNINNRSCILSPSLLH